MADESPHLDRFRALVEPGVIGNFTHCELTDIFACVQGVSGAQNVFTLAVLEERDAAQVPIYLTVKLFKVRNLKGWSFGIRRSVMTLADFDTALNGLDASGIWTLWGDTLGIGSLQRSNPQFVPADHSRPVPLNKVLKNNFWSGSHILEWADAKKELFTPLFEDPECLKQLAASVVALVPIDLAVMSDRLGNIMVQAPVTVLAAQCAETKDHLGYYVHVAWKPGANPRPLRVTVTADYDGTVTGLATAVVEGEAVTVPFLASAAEPKAYLLDEARNIVLAATGPLSGISQIVVNMLAVVPADPRTFSYTDRKGVPQSKRIALWPEKQQIVIGEPRHDPNGDYTKKRLYRFDTERVRAERLFEQYGLPENDPADERARALSDLHFLISRHGEAGAWLWDPYLDAIDVFETLFLSPHRGADLRGLSGGKNVSRQNIETFIEAQELQFGGLGGNLKGIRFEYRVAHSLERVDFHDRFLIFPREEGGDLAWSLGTSVNTLGAAHHILQRVEDGQRVSDAFQRLWNRMGTDQIVWPRP